jgi:hypothetical protein
MRARTGAPVGEISQATLTVQNGAGKAAAGTAVAAHGAG